MGKLSPTPLFDQEMGAQLREALEAERAAAARGDAAAVDTAAARVADLREVLARHHSSAATAVCLA